MARRALGRLGGSSSVLVVVDGDETRSDVFGRDWGERDDVDLALLKRLDDRNCVSFGCRRFLAKMSV